MKNVLTTLACLSVSFMLITCGGKKKGSEQYLFVAPLVANPYWDVVEKGAKAAAEKYAVELDYVGPTQLDINEMLKYMEVGISQKVKGIATMSLNEASITPIIDQADAAGIPVVLVDTDAPNSKRKAYAGTDNFTAGQELGKSFVRLVGEKATIGLMTGALDQPNLNARMAGFKDGIKNYPNIKIVATEGNNSDLQICIQKADAIIRSYPEIDALVGVEGFGVPGLSRAVIEAGKAGKIKVLGFDDLADTLAFIKDGTATATVVQKQYRMGYMGVELLVKLNKGESIDSVYDTGVLTLDKDNIDTFDPAK